MMAGIKNDPRLRKAISSAILFGILILSAYFRMIGLDWDQSQHLHPDERFMTMVVSALEPTDGLGAYFDTANSTLNPNNRGYTFYVYGDLPIVFVRYAAEGMNNVVSFFNDIGAAGWVNSPDLIWILGRVNWAGYDEVTLIGRVFAALFDLASLLFVYLMAKRLFNKKVALLAMLFAGLSVMLIQQSHFFTVDSYANFFMTLTVFFAIELLFVDQGKLQDLFPITRDNFPEGVRSFLRSKAFWLTVGFGVAFGSAMACKINAAPLAFLLPIAFFLRYYKSIRNSDLDGDSFVLVAIMLVVIGGLISILTFRIAMPYAFEGPSFFNFKPSAQWIQTIQEQRMQASGDVDFPPALQWARRSFFYSGKNLLLWGTGIPLGLTALGGFFAVGWLTLARKKKPFALLLWGWIAFYFLWQSAQWNPTMRYQLPIYPLIAILAAWLILRGHTLSNSGYWKPILRVFGAIVVVATFMWAFAFTRIYTEDHSRVRASDWIFQKVPGAINIGVRSANGELNNAPQSIPAGFVIDNGNPYDSAFRVREDGSLETVSFAYVTNMDGSDSADLMAEVFSDSGYGQPIASGSVSIHNDGANGGKGGGYAILLSPVINVKQDQVYFLRISSVQPLSIIGSAPIHETSWDDGLPLRMDGYDPYGGIYQGDLNLEMYWNDDQAKFDRFINTLNAGDHVFISSNRQWGTTTRLPERYPLTSLYYRELMGCPDELEILTCYNIAEPGMYEGRLGFELVATFTSYPRIFGVEFNTQFADEAFTVYDAPKVLIFKKSADYDPNAVQKILSRADLSKVIHVTPRKAADFPGDLMLDQASLAKNKAGGTWSQLFSYADILNKQPALGALVWYLFIFAIGLFTWPIMFWLFRNTHDKGYASARFAGLLLSAYLGWVLSSNGVAHERWLLWSIYAFLALVGIAAFVAQRKAIIAYIKSNFKVLLFVEVLFLALFLIDLVIRLSNPDLWHPYRGGERPMDLSFLNAVIKSTTFPPYDPWLAGGYINYYYYGFVIVSAPVKALGIVPTIAYNFILPTLFATVGVLSGAVVWNLALWEKENQFGKMVISGITGAVGVILIGNLGTIQLIFRSLQKMVVSNDLVDAANTLILNRWVWALQGLFKLFRGEHLPIGVGDYYWAPSRVMPLGDLAITEFPLFTFLYSDLHAHMIALPITIFVLLWAVVLLRSRLNSMLWWISLMTFGGFLVGTLKPTNTWDYPTYLIFAFAVITYVILRKQDERTFFDELSGWKKLFLLTPSLFLFFIAGKIFFAPFDQWYGLGYSEVSVWMNEKTPIWSTLTQWGFFFFIILFWMGKSTIDWLASTPVSALNKLKPYRSLIFMAVAFLIVAILTFHIGLKVTIAWFILIFAAWVLVLLFRPSASDAEKFVLFMVGTGLMLNLLVESVVLSGDIARMNTVFKFYYQAWTLFGISAAVCAVWLARDIRDLSSGWRTAYELGFVILLFGVLMFTFTAAFDKARDRMSDQTGTTLDSMEYMKTSSYWDQQEFSLADDYAGIRWMQDNIIGSPVIIEANTPEYRWGSRYTIYTGLPGVVGWNWHMRQQRAITPSYWVTDRVDQVVAFYQTEDVDQALDVIDKFDISYIVVGELERIYYEQMGLEKFPNYDGEYWNKVFEQGNTQIYEVIK